MRWALKKMKLIVESRIVNALVETKYMDKLIQIIDSENYPLEIQMQCLEAIRQICKTTINKKKILIDEIF